ncbi:unnamed protein product [Parascedosporium putredinis]|uniref:Alpha/beta hydrolase fold-3 domain-containing protein n=1 Tax=Parascedosporium putredinis TaxID=1442378 RepID=A0A9P1MGA8_9PEZI|nr:unnamed protein product [Parascedosporium putredinis]CAI8005069.1 unnamed protein product [Parascedosporium putredinis]
MDFSRYGTPSADWSALVAENPEAVREGYSGNHLDNAQVLRDVNNKARESLADKLMTTTGLRSSVTIETIPVASRDEHTIPVRRYARLGRDTDSCPVLIFFHGGGFLFGSETTDDVICATMALRARVVVLSIIYRHTPAHKHPAQHNDAWDAYRSILAEPQTLKVSLKSGVTLMGVSAGAGLAASVVLRDLACAKSTQGYEMPIKGVVLSIPWLIHIDNYPLNLFVSPDKASKIQCTDTAVIPTKRLSLFSDLLEVEDPTDPVLNTALAPDSSLSGWPKTAFLVAGMDPLRDDGLLFATRLEKLR